MVVNGLTCLANLCARKIIQGLEWGEQREEATSFGFNHFAVLVEYSKLRPGVVEALLG